MLPLVVPARCSPSPIPSAEPPTSVPLLFELPLPVSLRVAVAWEYEVGDWSMVVRVVERSYR